METNNSNSNANTWTLTNEEQKQFDRLKEKYGWVGANERLMGYKSGVCAKFLGPGKAEEMLADRISEMKYYRSIAAPEYKSGYDKIIACGEQLMGIFHKMQEMMDKYNK